MAVREGLEAAQRLHLSLAAMGGAPVPGGGTSTGSRWPQYQAPLPLTALARTCISASYLFLAAASSGPIAPTSSTGGGADPDASPSNFHLCRPWQRQRVVVTQLGDRLERAEQIRPAIKLRPSTMPESSGPTGPTAVVSGRHGRLQLRLVTFLLAPHLQAGFHLYPRVRLQQLHR